MGFINHHKVIVIPAQSGQVDSVGGSVRSSKVGVEQHIIVESIFHQRVVGVIIPICIPVVCQLLRAENENAFIAGFIVFYNCQRRKGLTKTNGVCQNTSIELFQFADDGKRRITLEIEQHTPDFAILKSGCLVGQCILRYIIEEFIKDIVQGNKVDEFR